MNEQGEKSYVTCDNDDDNQLNVLEENKIYIN